MSRSTTYFEFEPVIWRIPMLNATCLGIAFLPLDARDTMSWQIFDLVFTDNFNTVCVGKDSRFVGTPSNGIKQCGVYAFCHTLQSNILFCWGPVFNSTTLWHLIFQKKGTVKEIFDFRIKLCITFVWNASIIIKKIIYVH